MPRKKLIKTNQFPYHVTTRTNNKEWFNIPLYDVWKLSQKSLVRASQLTSVTIHAFVLMNNHYHLLITSHNSDIDYFMMLFNKSLSDAINRRSGNINHKFGGNYRWSIVQNQSYLYNVYRYVFQNPVRAGIVKKCEDYRFSSLNPKVIDQGNIIYKIELDGEGGQLREFFNTSVPKETDFVRKGLRRTFFEVARDKRTLKKFNLEDFTLGKPKQVMTHA